MANPVRLLMESLQVAQHQLFERYCDRRLGKSAL
jgi:hypothetical protein